MRKAITWRLLLMGFIGGAIWGVVPFVPHISKLLGSHRAVPFYQWLLVIALYGALGMGVAMLFPLWQKRIRIRNLLLRSIVFWVVVPTVLGVVHILIVGGSSTAVKLLVLHRGLQRLLTSGLIAGICFYLVAKLVGFAKVSGRSARSLK